MTIPWTRAQLEQVETVRIVGRTKERSCGTKKQFRTFEFAQKIAMEIFKRESNKQLLLEAYRCNFCGFFHLGHKKYYNHTK